MRYPEAVESVRDAIVRSVKLRLRSDVPLAFCMSGGVDSNALISTAKRLCGYDVHGFTVMSDDARYEERARSRRLSKSWAFATRRSQSRPTASARTWPSS